MSIKNSAILCELTISSYIGSKKDTRTGDEVTQSKNALKGAASVNKHLFNNVKELDDVNKFVAGTRTEFYRRTLPWSDLGARLVTTASFYEVNDWLAQQETEFLRLVDVFIAKYSTLVSSQAFQLGAMFDRSEYPMQEGIARKFKFTKIYTPVPEAGDFRVDIENDIRDELAKQYEAIYNDRTASAMSDLWDRLHTTLTHLSERLTPVDSGKAKIIRDAVVTNAVELCAMLKDMNVTGDADLETARKTLETTLIGVTPDDLRKSDDTKKDIKGQVDGILKQFNW